MAKQHQTAAGNRRDPGAPQRHGARPAEGGVVRGHHGRDPRAHRAGPHDRQVLHHDKDQEAIIDWFKTSSDLYIHAIQCVVVPLAFVNLAVSITDLIHIGKSQAIDIRVALFFLETMLFGIEMGFTARGNYDQSTMAAKKSTRTANIIQCSTGNYLEVFDFELVTCAAATLNDISKFPVDDANVLHKIMPANNMKAFVENTLLSMVLFVVARGITPTKNLHGPLQFCVYVISSLLACPLAMILRPSSRQRQSS